MLTFFWRSLVLNLAIFLSILWSNLTFLCCNFRFVLSTCAYFLSFFLLLINCLILLSYICFDFLILHFEKQSFNIELSLSDHFSSVVSTPLMSFQQLLRELLVLVCSELIRVNRLKSEACKGFLFYLDHDELVYFSSLAKSQRLTYVSVVCSKERRQS